MSESPSSILGALVLTGWIGEHPGDGGDFSMLMAYSPGDGALGPTMAQSALRDVIAAWGMREGTMLENPTVHGSPVTAHLDGTKVTISGFPGVEMSRPTSPEWAAIARKRGQVFLAVTTRTWPEGLTASDAATFRFVEEDRTINSAVSMLLPLT
ncbi:DUF5949 family protein [Streptomyces sp. NPDC047726]|uniref:DUF5949 family protein n=1 Tax=Streptomyces sp. NPDC047726 TaxID=3156651 RepID=UPI0033D621CA